MMIQTTTKKTKKDEIYKAFCGNVKAILKQDHCTQGDLAEAIGMSRSQFENKLSNNGARFNLLEIKMISDELLETIDDLIVPGLYEAL